MMKFYSLNLTGEKKKEDEEVEMRTDLESGRHIPARVRLEWEEGSLFVILILLPEESPEETPWPTSLTAHTLSCVCVYFGV